VTAQYSLDFPLAWGLPCGEALFREEPEDFQVNENLGFEPSGQGEHLCLQIEKRNQNTRWVAKLLAETFSVDEKAIGYCGLKDRRAVTRQWFSVHTEMAHEALNFFIKNNTLSDEIKIISMCRHVKKLRRGMHAGNDFVIRLRDLLFEPTVPTQTKKEKLPDIEQRLQLIAAQGVPNYFGEQRFGFDGGNLLEADKLLVSAGDQTRRHHKGQRRQQQRGGLYLSAARSYLFNCVLAERVLAGNWNQAAADENMPQGPLWGRGRSAAPASVAALEKTVLNPWQSWCLGLEFSGLQQERRNLILTPENFHWRWLKQDLELSFSLPPGAYATSILREIVVLNQPLKQRLNQPLNHGPKS